MHKKICCFLVLLSLYLIISIDSCSNYIIGKESIESISSEPIQNHNEIKKNESEYTQPNYNVECYKQNPCTKRCVRTLYNQKACPNKLLGKNNSLYQPIIDSKDNIYFTDGKVIYMLSKDYHVSKFTGGQESTEQIDGSKENASFTGILAMAITKDDQIIVADQESSRSCMGCSLPQTHIRMIGKDGSVNTIIDGRKFHSNYIEAIFSAEDGSIYFADSGVYKINEDGTTKTILRGSCTRVITGNSEKACAGLIKSISQNKEGNLLFADSDFNRIFNYNMKEKSISIYAGNGKDGQKDGNSTVGSIGNPRYLAVDKNGIVYISTLRGYVIRTITHSRSLGTYIGAKYQGYEDGNWTSSSFSDIHSIVIRSDLTIVLFEGDNTIRLIVR